MGLLIALNRPAVSPPRGHQTLLALLARCRLALPKVFGSFVCFRTRTVGILDQARSRAVGGGLARGGGGDVSRKYLKFGCKILHSGHFFRGRAKKWPRQSRTSRTGCYTPVDGRSCSLPCCCELPYQIS